MRRHLFIAALAALASAGHAPITLAQAYPSKPVRLLVPFPAGGGTDFFARTVEPLMAQALGQPLVVENKPGASTIIGAQELARSAADGYTILLGDTSTYAVNPSLFKKLPYDPKTSFAPITLTGRFLMLLVVNPKVLDVSSVKELIERAKKQPEKINYGSPGAGTPHHLAMELFAQQAGIKLTHVPYKGAAPAVQDLVGGQIGAMFLDYPTARAHLEGGRIKAIAVAAPKPMATLPNVPTVADSGVPGFEAWAWQGLAAPAGTPPDAIAKARDAYVKAVQDPAVRKKLVEAGVEPLTSTPQEMADYMASERAKWAEVIKAGNITVE